MAKPTKLTDEDIIIAFKELTPAAQINVYASIKTFMDEKESERKALSESYLKVEQNGK